MATNASTSGRRRRLSLVVAGLGLVALATACQPGDVSPMAGSGSAGSTGDAGPATAATLDRPAGVVAIPGGGFYVADTGQCVIRKVDGQGTITTVAGVAGQCGSTGDGGPATAAEIHLSFGSGNSGLALGPDGSLWFADFSAVRRVASDGTISTVTRVPGGSAVGPAATPDGTIYVGYEQSAADGTLEFAIERVAPDGSTTTVGGGTDEVVSLAAVDDTHLYLLDWTEQPAPLPADAGYRVDELNLADGTISSVVGPGHVGMQAGLAAAADGTLYLTGNVWAQDGSTISIAPDYQVHRIVPGATTTVIAGNGTPDPATAAQAGGGTTLPLTPNGLALTPGGGLLISSGHVVYRLDAASDAPGPS